MAGSYFRPDLNFPRGGMEFSHNHLPMIFNLHHIRYRLYGMIESKGGVRYGEFEVKAAKNTGDPC